MFRRRRHEPPAEARDPVEATIPDADRAILERCALHTMTGRDRLLALIDTVRHLVRADVPGAMAECGVWQGGSVLAMVLTLLDEGVTDRDVYLYDTFEGMTEPGESDVSPFSPPAAADWQQAQERGERLYPELFEGFRLDEVRDRVLASGYPAERLHFVAGRVEDTIPGRAPERLALLRLDTDWYESTRHELEHLYPRLSPGGVLIVDDYGHWLGSRKAVDEYFADAPVLLTRIDYAARLAVKASA